MELGVWKIRALLIFILSICIAITGYLFSGKSEVKPTDISMLPSVPTPVERITDTQSQPNSFRLGSNKNISLNYRPRYEINWANPLNYGDRYLQDIYGRQVDNQPIIVLHETVYSAASAINHFQTPHINEKEQASYHTLIKLDGTVVYIVPPDKRAFGAANSVFMGEKGAETVKTDPDFPPSVNNFAYHVSLETPPDGRNSKHRHSGYTDAEYQSLAWLIAQSKVPDSRITTHEIVDRSDTRIDPRSFNTNKFFNMLHSYRQKLSIKPLTYLN